MVAPVLFSESPFTVIAVGDCDADTADLVAQHVKSPGTRVVVFTGEVAGEVLQMFQLFQDDVISADELDMFVESVVDQAS